MNSLRVILGLAQFPPSSDNGTRKNGKEGGGRTKEKNLPTIAPFEAAIEHRGGRIKGGKKRGGKKNNQAYLPHPSSYHHCVSGRPVGEVSEERREGGKKRQGAKAPRPVLFFPLQLNLPPVILQNKKKKGDPLFLRRPFATRGDTP